MIFSSYGILKDKHNAMCFTVNDCNFFTSSDGIFCCSNIPF